MHTKRFLIFGATVCIAAMLAYLFVFADGPISELQTIEATPAPQ